MPPKAAAGEKMYDEVTVLGLLLVIKAAGGTYNKVLADMSALDGKRTTSSFEHSLRAVNKLAGELFEKQKAGHKLGPADIGRDANGTAAAPSAAANTPKKRGSAAAGNEDGGAAKKKRASGKKGGKKADTPVDGRPIRLQDLFLIMLINLQKTMKKLATRQRSKAKTSRPKLLRSVIITR